MMLVTTIVMIINTLMNVHIDRETGFSCWIETQWKPLNNFGWYGGGGDSGDDDDDHHHHHANVACDGMQVCWKTRESHSTRERKKLWKQYKVKSESSEDESRDSSTSRVSPSFANMCVCVSMYGSLGTHVSSRQRYEMYRVCKEGMLWVFLWEMVMRIIFYRGK